MSRGHGLPGSWVRPPDDPERDARVAARRAADARRAGAALDRIGWTLPEELMYDQGWRDGYVASQLHHNGDYGATEKLHAPGCRGAFGVPCAEWCDAA